MQNVFIQHICSMFFHLTVQGNASRSAGNKTNHSHTFQTFQKTVSLVLEKDRNVCIRISLVLGIVLSHTGLARHITSCLILIQHTHM